MNKSLILAAIVILSAMSFYAGIGIGRYQQAKKQPKISFPENMPGVRGATIENPDTVLMYQYEGQDTIRVEYYIAGRRLTDCSAENYPF